MVINRPKDLLRRYYEAGHFPQCHLEVHLGELEESLEKPRHPHSSALVTRQLAAKIRRSTIVPRQGDVRVHGLPEILRSWYQLG